MVIVIHQSLNTQNALFYNEKKVSQKKAFFFQSRNTPTINPFAGSKQDRWSILKEIEERNTRVKRKGLHISVNPTVSDLVKLGDSDIFFYRPQILTPGRTSSKTRIETQLYHFQHPGVRNSQTDIQKNKDSLSYMIL